MFEPVLQLIPEPDGEFSILATTAVPNARFSAGKASREAPEGIDVGAHVVPVRLALQYASEGELGEPSAVIHRVFNLKVADGDVVTAFVTLPDGKVLGSTDVHVGAASGGGLVATALAAKPASDAQPPLTPTLCTSIVVKASPSPGNFTDVTQLLNVLGVVDAPRAAFHRIRIGQLMQSVGHPVSNLSLIQSGPAIDVATCRDSVFSNAS